MIVLLHLIEQVLIMLKVFSFTLLMVHNLVFFPARSTMQVLSWFTNTNCSELRITKYKSISTPEIIATVSIQDQVAIGKIIEGIKSLPMEGDEMKKLGPDAKRTSLSFICEKSEQIIEIYNGKFKTPSTAFLSPSPDLEVNLVTDIEVLVIPALGLRIPRIQDHPVKFPGFIIKYTGTDHHPQPKLGATTGPTSMHHYKILPAGSANEVLLSIFDGQIPPQPQAFAVGKKVYYLLTFQDLSHKSLHATHFMISEQLP